MLIKVISLVAVSGLLGLAYAKLSNRSKELSAEEPSIESSKEIGKIDTLKSLTVIPMVPMATAAALVTAQLAVSVSVFFVTIPILILSPAARVYALRCLNLGSISILGLASFASVAHLVKE